MKIGFLGFGEMGSAIAEGLAAHSAAVRDGRVTLSAYAPHADRLRARTQGLPVAVCTDARTLASEADMIVLACKPHQVEAALSDLDGALRGRALISIVNGWGFADFKRLLGDGVRVQCIMPNTPVKVGKGTILLAEENDLAAEERETLLALLRSAAEVIELPEARIAAACAISGCGPAFLYMVIEALGDAGVRHGLSRRDAYALAAGTMIGAGEMVRRSGEHPGALKDAVCSPGGTTIRGVAALENAGMRAAFLRAVDAVLGA